MADAPLGIWECVDDDAPPAGLHLVLTDDGRFRWLAQGGGMEGAWTVADDGQFSLAADGEDDPLTFHVASLTADRLEMKSLPFPPGTMSWKKVDALPEPGAAPEGAPGASANVSAEIAAMDREEKIERTERLLHNFAEIAGVGMLGMMTGALGAITEVPDLATFRSDIPSEGLDTMDELKESCSEMPSLREKLAEVPDDRLDPVLGMVHDVDFDGLPKLTEKLSREDFSAYVYLLVTERLGEELPDLQDALNRLNPSDD